ncbi:putative Rap1 Myb domain-containing protein [Seiridium cardinale]|uniref:DNA-binding protein RAP1 n=1 Tax=Seiridium cardinale TaxID=138064 RepID=A0ABR2Y563_9PEZI
MPAPIVYEGQIQGHGGTLFKDMKFWVAHRVPLRSTWIQDIQVLHDLAHQPPDHANETQNNGGSVVQLDKHADFLIADHARKDIPAGSYSWKWIEDSVKGGKLLDKNDFLIGTPGNETRPVGSVQQKSTRTPFTKADDLLLGRFVTKHEREGIAVSGNVIYKQLEAKYPHHTYQSWRDRWVKKLQFLLRPEVPDGSPSPPAEVVPSAISAPSQPAPPAPTPTPQSSRPEHVKTNSPKKKTRAKFTPEEDALLLQYVEEMKANGQGASGKKAYENFAADFPQHTWQAWRDRYLKQLRPRESREDGEATPQPPPVRGNIQFEVTPKAAQPHDSVLPPVQQDDSNTAQPGHRPPVAPEIRQDLRQVDVKPEPREDDSSTSQPGYRSPAAPEMRQDLRQVNVKPEPREDEEQQLVDSQINGEVENVDVHDEEAVATLGPSEAGLGRDASPGTSSVPNQELVTSGSETTQSQLMPIQTREQFYALLRVFLEEESHLVQQQFKVWPTIQGLTFELWGLWTNVQAQKVEPAERDWQQIAEELGYNWVALPSAPDEVRHCYETHLSGFEDAVASLVDVDSGNEAESQSEEEEETELPQSRLPGLPTSHNTLSDGQFNSSPPKQPSLKRAHDSAMSSGLVYPESSRKRPKYGRDSEIPSTPDTKNGTSRLRPPVSAAVSPHDRRYHALPGSSQPLRGNVLADLADKEDEEMHDQDQNVFALPKSMNATIEPETQDFRFETQVMDDLQEETQPEVTPSQQLRSDIDAEERRQQLNLVSPTPKRFAKSPFLADDDDDDKDDDEEVVTPKPRYGKGPNALLSQAVIQTPKRRSLPPSYRRDASSSVPAQTAPEPTRSDRQASTMHQERSLSLPRPPVKRRSKAEELGEVVEYWMSLGYSHDIARRSLEATTWEPGLAGRIMQLLKDGNPMPTNWEGVWTPRDDDSLRLVDSAKLPRDEKEARKRARAADRIRDKHGEERLDLRRKWLAAKAEL